MIERFSLGASSSRLAARYKTEEPTFLPRYNGAPSQLFPVLTSESPQGFSYFYWGVAPQWAKNKSIAERLINVRVEQINEKPVLKQSLMEKSRKEDNDPMAICPSFKRTIFDGRNMGRIRRRW